MASRITDSPRELAAAGFATVRELQCVAPTAVADRRLRDRRAAGIDPSDATPEIAHSLATTFDPWPEATVIDTDRELTSSTRAVDDALQLD